MILDADELEAGVVSYAGKGEDLLQRLGFRGWKETELHRTPIVRHGSHDDTSSDPGNLRPQLINASITASATRVGASECSRSRCDCSI